MTGDGGVTGGGPPSAFPTPPSAYSPTASAPVSPTAPISPTASAPVEPGQPGGPIEPIQTGRSAAQTQPAQPIEPGPRHAAPSRFAGFRLARTEDDTTVEPSTAGAPDGAGDDSAVDYVGGIAVPRSLERVLHLVFFSVLPLIGVLVLGWDWRSVIVLYWLENVTVGASTIVRMLRTSGPVGMRSASIGSTPISLDSRNPDGSPTLASSLARYGLTGFFVIHFGGFTLVHGIFVFALVNGAIPVPGTAVAEDRAPIAWGSTLLVWLVGSAVAVLVQVLGPRPTATVSRIMASPYGRIIALHLTIILGLVLIGALGWPAVAAVLLIVLHAAIDTAGWVRSRRGR